MISLNTWSKNRQGRKEEQGREGEGRRWMEEGREEGEKGTVEGRRKGAGRRGGEEKIGPGGQVLLSSAWNP